MADATNQFRLAYFLCSYRGEKPPARVGIPCSAHINLAEAILASEWYDGQIREAEADGYSHGTSDQAYEYAGYGGPVSNPYRKRRTSS